MFPAFRIDIYLQTLGPEDYSTCSYCPVTDFGFIGGDL